MKRNFSHYLGMTALLSILAAQVSIFTQGSLTSPDAPSATMNRLDPIESRATVSSALSAFPQAGGRTHF